LFNSVKDVVAQRVGGTVTPRRREALVRRG